MINRKLVLVEWLDHCSFGINTWRQEEEFDDIGPVKCETIGWILKETDDYLIVVSTRNESTVENHNPEEFPENYLGDMLILKSCIKSIKEF